MMSLKMVRKALRSSVIACLLAACENPTAPELVKGVDAIERDIVSDSASANGLRGRFGGMAVLREQYLRDRGPNRLRVLIDGEEGLFEGIVLERVVVRMNRADRYPCPLVSKSLVGIDGTGQAIYLSGGDFSATIGAPGTCEIQPGSGTPSPWRPFMLLEDASGKRVVSVAGKATISRSDGDPFECKFVNSYPPVGLRVDCQLVEFSVAGDVRLAGNRKVEIPRQPIVGIRLTIHCDSTGELGGCEVMRVD